MRRFTTLIALTMALLCSAVLGTVAQEASPEAEESLLAGLGYPDLTITTDGTSFDVPAEIEAGRYRVVLENTGDLSVDLEFYQLPEGITVDDLTALFESFESAGDGPPPAFPDWFFEMVANGGPTTDPGGTSDVVLDLTPGEWVFNLFAYQDEGEESANIPTAVNVTGEMPAVEDPANAVRVEMVEMEFLLPETISAGPQIWQVVTTGEQLHHLILSQVPDGTTEEQVLELVGSFFGPPASPEASPDAAASPAAPGLSFEDVTDVFDTLALSTGQANWYSIDLAPGTYAAICFLPDAETGTPHVMLGMVEIFTVE